MKRDNRAFLYLASNQFFIQLAHSVFDISLIWLVLDLTGSNRSTGLIMATAYLPFLIFSLPAGVFADRGHKTRILQITSFVRIAIAALIPLLAIVRDPSLLAMGTAAFLLTALSALYLPARDALIPDYVGEGRLFRANSFIQGSMQLAYILGPVLAGMFIEILGKVRIFYVVSLLFAAGSLLSLGLRPPTKEASAGPAPGLRDIPEILSLLRQDLRLLWITIITMIDNLFIMGPAIIGIAIFVKSILHGSASDYAFCESSLALGMVAGTVILLKFGRNLPLGNMLIFGIFMDGLTYVPVYFIHSVPWLWTAIFFHALFIPLITVSRTTLIQKLVPPPLLGRFFSLISISVIGFTAISSAFTGLLSEWISIQKLFFIIGIGGALTGLISWNYKALRKI